MSQSLGECVFAYSTTPHVSCSSPWSLVPQSLRVRFTMGCLLVLICVVHVFIVSIMPSA